MTKQGAQDWYRRKISPSTRPGPECASPAGQVFAAARRSPSPGSAAQPGPRARELPGKQPGDRGPDLLLIPFALVLRQRHRHPSSSSAAWSIWSITVWAAGAATHIAIPRNPRNTPADAVHGSLAREDTPPADLLATGRNEVRRYGGQITDGEVTGAHRTDTGFDFFVVDPSTGDLTHLQTPTHPAPSRATTSQTAPSPGGCQFVWCQLWIRHR
jgi:hypothetical protein